MQDVIHSVVIFDNSFSPPTYMSFFWNFWIGQPFTIWLPRALFFRSDSWYIFGQRIPSLRPWILAKLSGVIFGNFVYVLIIFLQVPDNKGFQRGWSTHRDVMQKNGCYMELLVMSMFAASIYMRKWHIIVDQMEHLTVFCVSLNPMSWIMRI